MQRRAAPLAHHSLFLSLFLSFEVALDPSYLRWNALFVSASLSEPHQRRINYDAAFIGTGADPFNNVGLTIADLLGMHRPVGSHRGSLPSFFPLFSAPLSAPLSTPGIEPRDENFERTFSIFISRYECSLRHIFGLLTPHIAAGLEDLGKDDGKMKAGPRAATRVRPSLPPSPHRAFLPCSESSAG